eukprot:Sspe_Gene.20692::Locus_7620_Transcript_1_7_Confidence_0.333_Length_2355::g.20692::m.20692
MADTDEHGLLTEVEEEEGRLVPKSLVVAPSKAAVGSLVGVLYASANSIQRMMCSLIRLSDGLISEDAARKEVGKLEAAIQKASEVMEQQHEGIAQLQNLIEVYEKGVWEKTREIASLQKMQGILEERVFGKEKEVLECERVLQSLQSQIEQLESSEIRVDPGPKDIALLADMGVQTDPTQSNLPPPLPAVPPLELPKKGRRKLNPKHPLLLRMKCDGCGAPMSRRRWNHLPRNTRTALAELQEQLDLLAQSKRVEARSLLASNCVLCKEASKIGSVEAGVPPASTDLPPPLKAQRELLDLLLSPAEAPRERTQTPPPQAPTPPAASNAAAAPPTEGVKQDPKEAVSPTLSASAAPGRFKAADVLTRFSSKIKAKLPNTAEPPKTKEAIRHIISSEVLLTREKGKKLGLRLRDTDLQILEVEAGSLAAAFKDQFPLGHFIVSIGDTPVHRMGPSFRDAVKKCKDEILVGVAPVPITAASAPPALPDAPVQPCTPTPSPEPSPPLAMVPIPRGDDDDEGEECCDDPLGLGGPQLHRSSTTPSEGSGGTSADVMSFLQCGTPRSSVMLSPRPSEGTRSDDTLSIQGYERFGGSRTSVQIASGTDGDAKLSRKAWLKTMIKKKPKAKGSSPPQKGPAVLRDAFPIP